jgi:CubicO group peptidase (beta-lactamase class C family)
MPITRQGWATLIGYGPGNPFAGLDETIATDASDVGSVVVVRDHRLLFEYCKGGADPDALRNVQSVTKSVVSMAVGAAIGQGVLSSVDQSVPELVARIGTRSERAAGTKLTLRHLLAMTAGFAAASRVTRKQSDDPVFLLERERAAEPGTRFFVTRDMALLGQLMLEQGSWHGSQLVPASFVAEATAARGAGSAPYGYGWWVRPSTRGVETYYASGFGGQFIWVHAPLRLVIAVTSEVSERSQGRGHAMALIRNQLFKAASAWRPAEGVVRP